ncbi:MAG: hypothetical protein H6713_14340 [Myxococcales bacterium]|nr:hypothetical protein [Myxococcales bacterium]MCB9751153.1 hypothetical protein [Myxococcales bacterium]
MGVKTDYDPAERVRDARERYFLDNGFGAGGNYDEKWVRVDLGPIPVMIPNTPGRIRAVRYHDLHHIVTGYATDLVGEFEISAWEIGSGCGRLWFAWMINMTGMIAGLFVAPGAIYRAFVRGRHTRSLYDRPFDDALLERPLGELRAELGFASEAPAVASAADRRAFARWVTIAGLFCLLIALLHVAALALLVWLVISLLR